MLDPKKTVLVVKNKEGKEVGRIAATAPNTSTYLQWLAHHYKELTVDYVEDEDYAIISRLLGPHP